MYVIRRKILTIVLILAIVFAFIITFTNPNDVQCDAWINVEKSSDDEVWINTSHWENKEVWVQDGYYRDIEKREWIDTTRTINQGYWGTEEYRVWVESSVRVPYVAYRWISTSHWEQRYRYVTTWVPVNLTIYVGTTRYGWGVYSFAARPAGYVTIKYNGNRYHARKQVIDYRPHYGGRVYAIKYVCYEREAIVRQYYNVWVSSGFYQPYVAYRTINTSHWETRTRQVWVDTSYEIQSGYWHYYNKREWVDTSHFEYQTVWVEDGFYTSPLHGEVIIEKNPRYIFTKWHENDDGGECHMDLKLGWIVDNSELLAGEEEKEIVRVLVYQDVVRFRNRGTERVDIIDEHIAPSKEGSMETEVYFDHAGSEESLVHIYLYAQNGECAHIYFDNPVNGYRSINLGSYGSDSDAVDWLGGQYFGKIEF